VLVFWCNFLNLSSTSYLSCIVDTSCKQTLRLALSEACTSSIATQNNRTDNTILCFSHCILHCNTYPYRPTLLKGLPNRPY
jgi:hypothetical protein